ncbi:hypothetical protein BD779DRAFT_1798306 [Infundibulicybe gibba]|nr:hypothetical protein BD779DRAFT_1798306 [Infundibulicybe gibba]
MNGPPLDLTFGALFVGFTISCIIFGVTTLQIYLYFHYFPKDLLRIKLTVAEHHPSCLVDPRPLSSNRGAIGQLEGLFYLGQTMKLAFLLSIIIITLVHSAYTYRLWSIGGLFGGYLIYLVVSVVLGGFAIGILLGYKVYTLSSFSQANSIMLEIRAGYTASTLIDAVLTLSMCYYLSKSKGSFRIFNSQMGKMIQFTVGSGLLTLTGAFATLMTAILLPHSNMFVAIGFFTNELYVLSYISMLNARKRIQKYDSEGCGAEIFVLGEDAG